MRGVGRTTGVFAMLGTPSYMSPEQAQGQTDLIGPSTDVWAMGTILYEMATSASRSPARASRRRSSTSRAAARRRSRRCVPTRRRHSSSSSIARSRSIPTRRIVAIEELRAGLKVALESKLRMATPPHGTQAVTQTTGDRRPADQTPPFTTKTPSSPAIAPPPVTVFLRRATSTTGSSARPRSSRSSRCCSCCSRTNAARGHGRHKRRQAGRPPKIGRQDAEGAKARREEVIGIARAARTADSTRAASGVSYVPGLLRCSRSNGARACTARARTSSLALLFGASALWRLWAPSDVILRRHDP